MDYSAFYTGSHAKNEGLIHENNHEINQTEEEGTNAVCIATKEKVTPFGNGITFFKNEQT